MTAKELVTQAKNVQQESKASTTRTKEVLQHTINIGNDTSEALKKQTEQLQNVDQNLDLIESNLVRADKQIRIFLRRMASDKVVAAMVLMLVLAIIASVVVYVVRGGRQRGVAGLTGSLNQLPTAINLTDVFYEF